MTDDAAFKGAMKDMSNSIKSSVTMGMRMKIASAPADLSDLPNAQTRATAAAAQQVREMVPLRLIRHHCVLSCMK
jgi:hypothetical protein